MLENISPIDLILGPPLMLMVIFIALFIHEMGHYVAARIFKMPIKTIVIGVGRTTKFWNDKRGTRWSIRRWPLAAYVELEGLDHNFTARRFWKRSLTIIAGPLANVAIVPLIFFAFYITVGQPSTPAFITGVELGLAADKAGFEPGDQFLSVDGQTITNNQDMWRLAYAKGATQSTYVIRRDGKTFETQFTPDWIEYIDEDGITRKNARFGIIWAHAPYKLTAITSVNGEDTTDNKTKAHTLIEQNMDKIAVLDIKGINNESKPARVKLSSAANIGFSARDAPDFKLLYLGQTRGNIYMQKPIKDQAINALRYTQKLVANIASVPFQLLPVDPYKVKDVNKVTHPDSHWINALYHYVHLLGIVSIFVALFNLLPLPNLDGGQLLIQTIEHIRKTPLTNKAKAWIFVAAFGSLYATMLIANSDNVPRYIDSRLKKVHEFINE